MIHENNVDDRCQHTTECSNPYFTFCPRCQLFTCIEHLALHHKVTDSQLRDKLGEIKNYRTQLDDEFKELEEQRRLMNEFYGNRLDKLEQCRSNLKSIDEKLSGANPCFTFTADYQQMISGYQKLKDEEKQSKRHEILFCKINEILKENLVCSEKANSDQEQRIVSNLHSPLRIVIDDFDDDKIYDLKSPKSENGSFENSQIEEEPNGDKSEFETSLKSFQPENSFNLNISKCPLSTKNAFGLTVDHKVPNVPCRRFKNGNNSMTYDWCLRHLTRHHQLRQEAARLLLETLIEPKKPKSIDLFSQWTKRQLLDQSLTNYIDFCPLANKNIYGLPLEENLIKCNNSSSVRLYHHLRFVHDFRANCARRLIIALIDKEPFSKKIFQPNEIIFHESTSRPRRRKAVEN